MTDRQDVASRPASPPTPRQLALLRRYFRAVVGDQQAGDKLVSSLAPRLLLTEKSTVALLTAATRLWRQLVKDDAAPAFSSRTIAEALSPALSLERQAGVMVDVFGLTLQQAAGALNRSAGEVTRLLAEGRRVTGRPIGGRVLVVDDDPLIARHLAGIVAARGAAEVQVAASYDEAVGLASVRRFDLALCDYDLGRGRNGLDVVRVLSAEHDTTCVFVTAYPDEVLSGSDHEPAFVIIKPFRDEVVAAALSYAVTQDRPALVA